MVVVTTLIDDVEGVVVMNYRNTWAEVDLNAISYNIQQLKNNLPEGHQVMTVVKAGGYGHGSVQVAKVAEREGITFLMVALLEEAITLREGGIELPILVIGRVPAIHAKVAAEYNITLTLFDEKWLEEVKDESFTNALSIHLEFETGMNRTGIGTEKQLKQIVNRVSELEHIHITGAYMHFATADEIQTEHYEKQKQRYHQLLHALNELHAGPLITHIGNSAAGIQYPKEMLHYTRFGVATYGLYPSADIRALHQVDLKQAMLLYSELIQVKQISPGECVSYGATYCAEETEWIGTIPIGYGDGWSRSLQGFHVLINGKKMPIVGRICMDVMMVKLDQPYEVGQKVTLIGEDNGAMIGMDEVANHLGTINYEIPCMLTSRIPRIYV